MSKESELSTRVERQKKNDELMETIVQWLKYNVVGIQREPEKEGLARITLYVDNKCAARAIIDRLSIYVREERELELERTKSRLSELEGQIKQLIDNSPGLYPEDKRVPDIDPLTGEANF